MRAAKVQVSWMHRGGLLSLAATGLFVGFFLFSGVPAEAQSGTASPAPTADVPSQRCERWRLRSRVRAPLSRALITAA